MNSARCIESYLPPEQPRVTTSLLNEIKCKREIKKTIKMGYKNEKNEKIKRYVKKIMEQECNKKMIDRIYGQWNKQETISKKRSFIKNINKNINEYQSKIDDIKEKKLIEEQKKLDKKEKETSKQYMIIGLITIIVVIIIIVFIVISGSKKSNSGDSMEIGDDDDY